MRSLLKHFDEVKHLILSSEFDIFCLNETRLANSVADLEVSIPNYSLFRKDRSRVGGGVAIYVKSNIDCTVISELINSDIEALWLQIKCPYTKPFQICAVYRPPSSSIQYSQNFLLSVEKAISKGLEIIMLGDINIDSQNKTYTVTNLSYNLCTKFNFAQLVNQPTRVTAYTSTIIDHIYTTMPSNHIKTNVLDVCLSDHYLIYTELNLKKSVTKNSKTIMTRSYNNFSAQSFLLDLKLEFSSFKTENLDIDTAWHQWKDKFNKISSKHAPLRCRRVKNTYKPWVTKSIISL